MRRSQMLLFVLKAEVADEVFVVIMTMARGALLKAVKRKIV